MKYITYWKCPVCGRKNTINSLLLEPGGSIQLELNAPKNSNKDNSTYYYSTDSSRVTFICKCGAKFEIGLEEVTELVQSKQ